MKAVASFRTLSQAQALRIALEADGIRAAIGDEQAVSLVAGSVAVSILDDRDYERARAIAVRLEGPVIVARDDASRRCPRCDAENPMNFTACWNCQADLSGPLAPAPPPRAGASVPATRPATRATSPGDRRLLNAELGIVLVLSFWSLPIRVWERAGAPSVPSFREPLVVQLSNTAFFVGFAALLLFLIWRRAGSLEPAGLAHLQWSWELLFGVLILGATLLVFFVTSTVASMAGLQTWRSEGPSPVGPGVFYPLMLLAAAFHEEVLFRGYLIGRFETLAGRAAPAVLLSSLLFAIRHVASPARSLELVGAGLLWGGIFASARRLPRLVFAHWAWNLMVLYWLPQTARP